MKKAFGITCVAVSTIAVILVSAGCAGRQKVHTVPMRPNLTFSDRSPKIPLSIGLYVSRQTREQVIRHQLVSPFGKTDEYRQLAVGSVLLPNGVSSLSKAFTRVNALDAPGQGKAYYVELEIDPASSMDVGRFLMSEKKVDLHLRCSVKRGNGALLWRKVISSKSARANPRGWTAGLLFGAFKGYAQQASYNKLQAAGEESLYICLETLNSELVEKRGAIFR